MYIIICIGVETVDFGYMTQQKYQYTRMPNTSIMRRQRSGTSSRLASETRENEKERDKYVCFAASKWLLQPRDTYCSFIDNDTLWILTR